MCKKHFPASDDLLLLLPSDSDRLTEKKMNSEDVTMEVIDTKSRLETKKEVRGRYLDLLKQARNILLGVCTLWPIWVMCLLGWMLWRRMVSRLPKRAAGTRT